MENQTPKVSTEAVETVAEVQATVQEEQPADVLEIQVVECITQIACSVQESREKAVPSVQTRMVGREV